MKSLLRIAQKLDKSGQYKLADKIAQVIMDTGQYLNNPYTPKEIMDIRKQIVDTDFRGLIYQTEKGDTLLSTSDGMSFAVGLMDFARMNKFPTVQAAFDAYADAGAIYRGKSIKKDPVLQELYKRISKTQAVITRQMLQNEIQEIYREKSGMFGKFESSPNAWQRNIDPKTGADLGYLEHQYNQMMEYAGPNDIRDIYQMIDEDEHLPEQYKQKLQNNLEYRKFKTRIESGNYSETLLNEGWRNLIPDNFTIEQKQDLENLINDKVQRIQNRPR